MEQEKKVAKTEAIFVFLKILLSYFGAFLIVGFVYSILFILAKMIIVINIPLSHYIASIFTIALLQFLAIPTVKKKFFGNLVTLYNSAKKSRLVKFIYDVGADEAIRNLVALCSLPITTSLYIANLVILIVGRLSDLNVIVLKDPLLSIISANEFSILILIALDRVSKAFEREKKEALDYLQMLKNYIEKREFS